MSYETNFPLQPFNDGFGMSRSTDPSTSQVAGALVNTTERELQVIDALVHLFGEGTNEEIAAWLSQYYARPEIPSNVSPRIAPLRNKGLLVYAGYTRKSRQGRANRVWKLTPAGWDLAGGR